MNKIPITTIPTIRKRCHEIIDKRGAFLIEKYKYSFNGFILPGQTSTACAIHITRCVARRTELAYAKVYSEHHTSDIIFEYLNKLGIKAIRGPRKISKEVSEKIKLNS